MKQESDQRFSQRRYLGGGLSYFVSETMLTSPAFRKLETIEDIGVYLIMYARADSSRIEALNSLSISGLLVYTFPLFQFV